MTIETIIPKDEAEWLALRKLDVTSTEVAALFGCSPYMTEFELWHRKHDNLEVDFKVNERMIWGTRLQDSIAAGIAQDQGWTTRRMTEYIRDPDLRMGASFDFEASPHVTNGFESAIASLVTKYFLLEIKNVDSLAFREGWIVEGDNVEAPPHVELQVQQQLALAKVPVEYIGALIGGNRVVLIKRTPDPKIIEAIKRRVREFWLSISEHKEPKPDFARDSGVIARIFSYAEPGKAIDADDRVNRLAMSYKQAVDTESEARKEKEAKKAEILTLIGNAEKVSGNIFTISSGMIGPAQIPAYERKGYRSFKISWKREK